MQSAVVKVDGAKDYMILLPDNTVAVANTILLRTFLSKFNEIDNNPFFRDGKDGKWNDDDPMLRKAKTYAYITDSGELIICDFAPFETVIQSATQTKYLSTKEYADKIGKSVEQVKTHCQNGRIPGATKVGQKIWVIPENAPYPLDGREIAGGIYKGFRNR